MSVDTRSPRHIRSLILALTVGALAGGSLVTAVGQLTEPAPASAVTLEEDHPAWECLSMGNRVCGESALTEELTARAWETWDAQQGWRDLHVDPTREFRIDVTGYSLDALTPAPDTVVLTDLDGLQFEYSITYP